MKLIDKYRKFTDVGGPLHGLVTIYHHYEGILFVQSCRDAARKELAQAFSTILEDLEADNIKDIAFVKGGGKISE